jgi:hypothetical protein
VQADLARRALAVVLGPPHAPPGAVFWADLAQQVIESASKRPGGVRTYLAAGTAPASDTPLAGDARAGRFAAALLLGAGEAAAAVLREAGIPHTSLASDGPPPAVRIAWREATRDLVADILRRGIWPLAVQLPPGHPGDEIAAGYREAVAAAGKAVDEGLIGRTPDADGPAGWAWVGRMATLGARGCFLAGERPEGALAAIGTTRMAVATLTLSGRTPAFGRALARLELDAPLIVQAGFEMLADIARSGEGVRSLGGTGLLTPALGPGAEEHGRARPAVAHVRTIAPRFIEGETLAIRQYYSAT